MKNLFSEQNLSMLLGVLVVVLIGNLVFSYFKTLNKTGQTLPDNAMTTDQLAEAKPGNDYEVAPGDTLWSISVKTYGTGYNWLEIYKANVQILGTNPDSIEEGTKIALPVIAGQAIAPVAQPTKYTVVKGDYLWSIAVKVCNNGFAWGKIAAANHLRNANYVEVGQQLTIACN